MDSRVRNAKPSAMNLDVMSLMAISFFVLWFDTICFTLLEPTPPDFPAAPIQGERIAAPQTFQARC
jgi:hypothetical protein